MAAPKEIVNLVERFESNLESYESEKHMYIIGIFIFAITVMDRFSNHLVKP